MENIIRQINTVLNKYHLFLFEDEMINDFLAFISLEEDCHQIDHPLIYENNTIKTFSVMAVSKKKIVSYLTFSVEKSEISNDMFVQINYTCTKMDNRRKGLSTLLRILPIMYAYENGINFVVSDTNAKSSGLLKHKFGFTITDNYIDKFNWDANAYLDISEINDEYFQHQFKYIEGKRL